MGNAVLAQIKTDNQEASNWLLFYPFRKSQFYRDKMDIMNSTVVSEIPTRSGPGNPTMAKMMTLSGLLKTETWLETIEIVEDMLSEKKLVFLQVRREAAYLQKQVRGRPAWVIYVQHHYSEEMARRYNCTPEKFWIGERTISQWWNQMVELTARVAIKRNCI